MKFLRGDDRESIQSLRAVARRVMTSCRHFNYELSRWDSQDTDDGKLHNGFHVFNMGDIPAIKYATTYFPHIFVMIIQQERSFYFYRTLVLFTSENIKTVFQEEFSYSRCMIVESTLVCFLFCRKEQERSLRP